MIDLQQVVPAGADEVAEINRRLYESASAAQREWADQAAEALEYFAGQHWTSEQRDVLLERGQAPFAIQALYQIVEQAVGTMTDRRPAFRASAREDGDAAVADIWSDLFQWMWQQSRGQQHLVQAVRDYYVQGRGQLVAYIDQNADYGKGEVLWRSVDPKAIIPDPRSQDYLWDDAAFILVRQLYTLDQIEQYWPGKAEMVKEQGRATTTNDHAYARTKSRSGRNEHIHPFDIADTLLRRQQYEVIERYERVLRPHFRLFNPQTGQEEVLDEQQFAERQQQPAYLVQERGVLQIATDPDHVQQLDQLFNEMGGVFHMQEGPPQITPDGQVMAGPPVPVPGEGPPELTTYLEPTTIGQLIEQRLLPMSPFQQHRIQVSASAGHIALYEPYELPTRYYPVIPLHNGWHRNPYSLGDVARLRDLQDLVNKSQSLILAWQASATNLKVFYPIGGIPDMDLFEQEWSKAGTGMIPYNPAVAQLAGTSAAGASNGGINIVTPPPLPNALFDNIDRSIALMERIAGVYATGQGEQAGGRQGETFRGTLASDEVALRRMSYKLDQVQVALERLGQVMLELAQRTYTREKVLRLRTPTGSSIEQRINQQVVDEQGQVKTALDITTGRYDVIIVSGSTLPSNRWARLESYLQLFDRNLVDDISVLRATEIPDADAILERRSIYQQQQQAIDQYGEEIKRLRGDLQTAERESVSARKRVEVSKFRENLKSLESKVQADARLYAARLDDELKNQRATAQAPTTENNVAATD